MPLEIRNLGCNDARTMRDMFALFGDAFSERDTYTARQPPDEFLASLLASDSFIAIAALDGSQVIGGLVAYVLPKFEQARSEIYIYDLAVAATHRRRGVATAIVEQLKSQAPTHGAWVIYVQADHGDEPAISLYTKLGIGEDVLHFDIQPEAEAVADRGR